MRESSNQPAALRRSGVVRVMNSIALNFLDVPRTSYVRSLNDDAGDKENRAIAENLKPHATSA